MCFLIAFQAALEGGAWPLVLVAVLASAAAAFFYVRVAVLMFFTDAPVDAAPHVVVRVNDALHAQAHEALERLSRGCDARLVVLAEPDIAFGDCRIEWADGGIRRERAAVEAAIDEAVARYIAARTGKTYIPDISWRPNR